MRLVLWTLVAALFLAGVLAPGASAQWGSEYLYKYVDLAQYGDTVYGYAASNVDSLMYCYPGWVNCWVYFGAYVDLNLYKDGVWRGGYPDQESSFYAETWIYDTASAGYWEMWTEHELYGLYYLDEWGSDCYIPSIWKYDYRDLTINPEISISGSQYVQDGGTGYFNVTVQYGVPTGYQWSFENSSPAGNAPDVTFSPPTETPTLTDAHWYAYPDSACSAGGTATYPIAATVGFDSGSLSDWTWLWVNAWWDPTGFTGAPNLPIDLVPYFSNGLWRVHTNTQVQKVYSFSMIWVPGSSQFWYKTFVHEQEHVRQWAPGGTMGDLYNPEQLRARLLDLSAATQADLAESVQHAADVYMWEQAQLSLGLKPQSEREAYAISDNYAPRYIYQGQCKGY
jgi:hypothetical protein